MEEIHIQTQANLPSIEHILRPITYTSWLLGAGVAHPRKYPKIVTIILRIIYLALCFIGMIFHMKSYFNIDYIFENIYHFFIFIHLVINYVSTYYYIYQVIRQYDKWPDLMDKIKEFDEKIRKKMLINNRPVKIAEALAILVTFICCPLCIIVAVLYFYFTNPKQIGIDKIMSYYILAQSLINSFVFDVVVYALYYRLKAINKLVGQLNEFSDALKIRSIRKMHNGICDLVTMVNDIYGFNLLICSLNCLISVQFELSTIYMLVMENNPPSLMYYVYIITCLVLYTTQFGLMCWNCTLARREFHKTGIIIYAIALNFKHVNFKLKGRRCQSNLEMQTLVEGPNRQNSVWNTSYYWNNIAAENFLQWRRAENLRKNLNCERIRNEINDFLIQLQHRRIVFTVCDYFELNNGVFGGFIGIAIVYMTVFIQCLEV
ncbi:uncharacterized protein LOC105831479 [Monomorium pharaonis]|uniref:uncharacterized protein LOC105831479 n=1 Tax=Monomorium pharaonis TaxID=307658 RepID=UPI00102E17F4|nr:uncharacterized protein LOC105831479 [Monomorium pharaonis]